ncbi:MAG: DUF222 domain-containing protein [Acidimicrobiales bacterium]
MTAVGPAGPTADIEPADAGGGAGAPDVTGDDLSEAIVQLHAAERAVHLRLLEVIRTFERSKLWVQDGAPTMAQWLVARLAISPSTAAEWVRVADALADLPSIGAVAAEGRLSWDQLAPLTRLADPETDEALAVQGPGWTAAQTRHLAARARAPRIEDANAAHARRRLRWWSDDHQLRLRGELPTEAGAVLVKVLGRMASEAPPDPRNGTFEPYEARCADALVELASLHVADDADADRSTVIVHADAASMSGDETGLAELEDGPRLAVETARRLACDCRWQLVVENETGDVVRLGRMTRQVPPWLVRQLRRRDRGCRFVGCGRTRWLHTHHIDHWVDGGATDPDNLVLMCGYHHRYIHEGGWSIAMAGDGEVSFRRPNGTTLSTGPPPLRPDVNRRLFGPDPPPAAA